ncbi:MAG: protease inhibitor I42 family protein [bacterium]
MKSARRALPALAIALVLAISLFGCRSGDITVTEEDAGTIQAAHVGDRVTVRLDGNPSTGFNWTRTEPANAELAGPALRPIEEGTWEFPMNEQVPGMSGMCLFRYVANEPGTVTLSFAYGRSWESEPVDTFSVVIWVRE